MEATNQPIPVILDDEALAEIEARRPRTVHYNCPFVPLSETERDSLCQTVRALRAESERLNRLIAEATVTAPWRAGYTDYVPTASDPVRSIKDLIEHIQKRGNSASELESSLTFWQAEALLNHFCSEHASSERQKGHYCTVCAKPFVMTVPQGERPPKYKDLITENTALREQLAEVELARNQLSSALSVRDTQLSDLQSRLAQVEQERLVLIDRAINLFREKSRECDSAAKASDHGDAFLSVKAIAFSEAARELEKLRQS